MEHPDQLEDRSHLRVRLHADRGRSDRRSRVEVGLEPEATRHGARRRALSPPSRLDVYVTAVSALGAAAIAVVVYATPWVDTFSSVPIWATLFLAAAAVIGEVKPIHLPRAGREDRTLSTSAPFVLALVAVAGVGVAVLAQVLASLTDDLINRRAFKKSFFNTAQYSLSVLSAGAIFGWLRGVPVFSVPTPVTTEDIGPLLVGGAVMFIVNWLLVAGVVAIVTRQNLIAVLSQDPRTFVVTNLVLLSIGGIAAIVAADGPLALVLLAAPVIAAHLFAASAAKHAYEASHDMLTGLGNRGQLHHELLHELSSAQKGNVEGPGLVLLDLDHFKDINDTLGHPFGDLILRKVADELVAAAPDNASVHRLGGDEFAVVVGGGVAEATATALGLLASLDNPVRIEGLELLIRASAGVAVAPAHGTDSEMLMKNVDIALYHAKLERDRISVYSPELDINTVERLQLLADLRTALDDHQLYVVYQPQVDLNDSTIVGVEALVRWRHPRRGLVNTQDFIALAESSGLIVPLTAYVLDAALAQLALWRGAGHNLRIAVNLSARLLSDLSLPQQVAEVLDRHRIAPSSLVLEVTETGILADAVRADTVVRALRSLGVAIAIDDYGTGNASLSYLKRLEIDELKVDKSFVSNIGSDNNDLIIVRSTISLARALGLRVVAEGIEDEATTVALRELGCPIGQGYHLGRPVEAAELESKLNAAARAK